MCKNKKDEQQLDHTDVSSDEDSRECVEVHTTSKHYYAMTLRKTKTPTDRPLDCQHYEERLKQIRKLGITIDEYVYEETSGLHVHGLCLVPRYFNFKRLRMRGWNIVLEEIYDYNGWLLYMMKDQAKEVDPEQKWKVGSGMERV